MIFSVAADGSTLTRLGPSWSPRELDVEKFLVHGPSAGDGILNESIFGEELLLISRQVVTTDRKRTDIVALDRRGNSVFIELKRDQAVAGVGTQALQYLASFAPFHGQDFLARFKQGGADLADRVGGFLGTVPLQHVNRRQRIILLARGFERALFSMGKWFGSNDVAFRCIAYTPIQIQDQRFISFSVAFDQSLPETFPLSFGGPAREPGVFWHNIGVADQQWWSYLLDKSEIPASFDNQPGDSGEQLLKGYVRGDRIVAYAKGFGAMGWGVIEKPDYRLVDAGSPDDRRSGELRHRLPISWKATARRLEEGIAAAQVRSSFDIYHPVSTSVSIDAQKAEALLAALNERFPRSRP